MADMTTESQDQILGLKERRAFMRLPMEERQRQLAEQAADFAEGYRGQTEELEREEWQGGDIVECSAT
jgi:hypothetical protein